MQIAKTIAKHVTVVVLTILSWNSFGQQDHQKQINDSIAIREIGESAMKHTIVTKTNPFAILWGGIPYTSEYRLMEEFRVSLNQTFTIGASYLGISPVFSLAVNSHRGNGQPKEIAQGYRFQAAYKYYPSRENYAPDGFYVGSMISYSSVMLTYQQANVLQNYLKVQYFNISLIAGRQFFFRNIALDVFFGMGYKKDTFEEHYTNNYKTFNPKADFPFSKTHFKLAAGLNIGWGK
jgi:hypothetical protein